VRLTKRSIFPEWVGNVLAEDGPEAVGARTPAALLCVAVLLGVDVAGQEVTDKLGDGGVLSDGFDACFREELLIDADVESSFLF